ncbi:MAG TPA: hypothetical protein VHA52_09795 [Candidatus Babeliaceae bacterium]|nr:hypothetical protein [Candidatus Babeliaceae bacterium]
MKDFLVDLLDNYVFENEEEATDVFHAIDGKEPEELKEELVNSMRIHLEVFKEDKKYYD